MTLVEAEAGWAVSVRDLTVEVGGARLLDGVDLQVAPGRWVGVVGPNGAGKSTLLRAIAGIGHVTAGQVELIGRPGRALRRRERSRLVALVAQDPVVPPGLTVSDYVLLGRTPHLPPFGREGTADLRAVEDVLAQLDLLPLASRTLHTLSGGELQRAVLARALAQQAPVLLLDEPTSALDVGRQQEVLELVDRMRSAHGLAVVSTMHDLTLAGQYADRLVLLEGGRVHATGSPAEVLTEATLGRFSGARVRVVQIDGMSVVVPVRSRDGEVGRP
ncbi:MAG: ABC transporter ATP-binding protein [Acidimicrobiales bacterium]|nr:ABC transporter ATP-binding protein [Acidimicrobiales bacterium]